MSRILAMRGIAITDRLGQGGCAFTFTASNASAGRIANDEPGRVVKCRTSWLLARHGFQNPCDGMRNARLKREDEFSHAMIIVISAMVSSS